MAVHPEVGTERSRKKGKKKKKRRVVYGKHQNREKGRKGEVNSLRCGRGKGGGWGGGKKKKRGEKED